MVKCRDSNQENEGSDALTKGGARKAVSDSIDPTIPMEFDIQGAKLSAVTQATYRGILERKPRNERGAELQKTTYNEYAGKQSLTSQVTWPHPVSLLAFHILPPSTSRFPVTASGKFKPSN